MPETNLVELREKRLAVQWGTLSLLTLVGVIILGLWGCPRYKVYAATRSGESELARATYNRQIAVAEARAKMEAAALLSQADTLRAIGVARSNQIIGASLKNNESYLYWLFIDQLKDTKDQIIYIPSGNMGMPIMEAGRLNKPTVINTNEK